MMENGIARDQEKSGGNYEGPDASRNPVEGQEDEEEEESENSWEPEEFDDCDCDDPRTRLDRIPYLSVYDKKEAVRQKGYFIPAFPVTATIVKVERYQQQHHLISPYIYTINLKHGPHEWTVHRRYAEFQHLNQALSLYRTAAVTSNLFSKAFGSEEEGVDLSYMGQGDLFDIREGESLEEALARKREQQPAPSVPPTRQDANGRRFSAGRRGTLTGLFKEKELDYDSKMIESQERQKRREARHAKLPHFPVLPDFIISEEALEERKMRLQNYLSTILHIYAYRDHYETAQFLGVGRLSFVHSLGKKYKEGLVKRRPGGKYARSVVRNFCITRFLRWRRSWVVIKDSFLAYIDPKDERIGDVILFDRLLKIRTKADQAEEMEGVSKGLHLSNMQRELLLKCDTEEDAEYWKGEIEDVVKSVGEIWMQDHPNESTFPVRQDVYANWFVDGRGFMEHAAKMIEIAKEEIFITDWWLNPHIYMKRPSTDDRWRLDQILQRKANAGVRVFLLIYREVAQALALGSLQMEQYMTSLSPCIKVLRHPDHVQSGIMSFAHHEKLIVIDQKIAFVGGIDLCYMRWDDHEHRLTDLGGLETCSLVDDEQCNEELEKLRKGYEEEGSPPDSPAANDKVNDMITKFTFNAQKMEKDNSIAVEGETKEAEPLDIVQILQKRRERMEMFAAHPIWRSKLQSLREQLGSEYKELWKGKDYGNALIKDIPEPDKAFDDFVDRSVIPRMPWHDISCVVYGKVARDVARHFIHRWNAAKIDLAHQNDYVPFLVPKSYENIGVPPVFRELAKPCNVQVLRSSSLWSAGMKETEKSIQNAYVKIISEAKYYIYIENQFFVSQIGGTDVHNKVAQALFDRIVRAHRENEPFRVYVLMPLLPGFTKACGSMQIVLHWTYASINKGNHSLLHNLENAIGDYSKYITFCGLRKHAMLLGKLVTELIYIHSKLLIADDRVVLIGSANINDRSQMGDRDSEVAVVMEDTQFTPSTMNGQPHKSGLFAGSLRRRLFQEHLGLLIHENQNNEQVNVEQNKKVDVTDPVSSQFFDTWNNIAQKNTEIFDQVFKCAPSDELTTLESWGKREAQTTCMATTDRAGSMKLLEGVQGHLVKLPLQFLSKSDLQKDRLCPEALMPSYIFT